MRLGRQKSRALVKVALATVCERTGVLTAFTWARRQLSGARVHILGFHRVVDDLDALGPEVIPSLCITTRSLDRLLGIARERFDVLPLEEAVERLDGQERMRRDAAVITFDDAYRDVYLRALPVLRRHALPGTVFVPTGLIGSPEPLLHDRLHALLVRSVARGQALDEVPVSRPLRLALARAGALIGEHGTAGALAELIDSLPAQALRTVADALEDLLGETASFDEGARVMDERELRECADAGLDLGAHTVGHVALVREPSARVRRELERPRRDLEAIAGRPCRTFSYCNGLWTPTLLQRVREAGYVAAVTTADRPNVPGGDPLLLGRKMLWEGHVRALGAFSRALSAAQLHDLFGLLGLDRPVEGRREPEEERVWWSA